MKKPVFPRTHTLVARALVRLLSGRQFTHLDFQRETATYRLSACIYELRNRYGWPIEKQEETAPTRDPVGRKANYGRYYIKPEILTELRRSLGERLAGFISAVTRFEITAGQRKANNDVSKDGC